MSSLLRGIVRSVRRLPAGAWGVALVLCAAVSLSILFRAESALVAAQPDSIVIPKFRVEPGWLKVPDRWVLGIVSSVAVDRHDHIWVLQRPSSLEGAEKAKAAPPVLEFDGQGAFVQAWGGPGSGFDWPENEHGIYVDADDHVWIGGQGEDDQILKFTSKGRFVLQIGHAKKEKSNNDTTSLWKPADLFVHERTRELFVADGYGNKRVIVFDAVTGAFKRMWGAFGRPPKDDAADPAERQAATADLGPDGPMEFVSPVHAIRVSNDGLVYVADRGGRRVQVFTLEGQYRAQVFIGRECHAPDCGNGSTAAGLAFSADPGQRYLYVANRSQAQLMIFDRQTLHYLDSFGQWGSAAGQFGTLHHLASDSRGNLYTAEVSPLKPENRRVQRFSLVEMVTYRR